MARFTKREQQMVRYWPTIEGRQALMEVRTVPTDGALCACGRTAVILIDSSPYCDKHKTRRVRRTVANGTSSASSVSPRNVRKRVGSNDPSDVRR